MKLKIAESTLDSSSEEVSTTIAGYIAKKLAKRSNCDSCKSLLIASSMDLAENHYLNLLSRGGLIVPSAKLAEYTSHCFAIMDFSYNIVQAHGVRDLRTAYTQIFDKFSPQIDICCSKHNNWELKFAAKIVINTFLNNKQFPLILRGRTLLSRSRNAKEPNNWFSFIAVLCFCYPELVKCLVTLFVCSLL